MTFNEWLDAYIRSGAPQAPAFMAAMAWEAAIDEAAKALDKREEEAGSAHTMVPEILALKASETQGPPESE